MKQPIARATLLTFAIALAGCAGMDARSTYVAPEEMSSAEYREALYITRIESMARRRGIDVVWVNPPRASSQSSEEDPR